jgi:alkylation response protein AidB-like acyl-CoA dehydrogenase
MDFDLTDEQQKLQDEAIKFAQTQIEGDMVARDRNGTFSRESWTRCAEFGVLNMPVPTEYGGLGMGLTTLIAVMEGLGYGTRDHGLLFSLNAHLWTNTIPILIYGTEEQKQKYLPKLGDGTLIGANGASEPESGSDIFSLRTRAEKRGDHYVLNGTKMFVSNAPVADTFVCYATIDPARGPLGITAFILERGMPGLTVTEKIDKMGLRTSPMAELVFEDCVVPLENRLGRVGRGVEIFECSMEWERGCILATCLGAMRRQLEECIAHARGRKQFGQAIAKFQSVANRIVRMKVRLDACRPLVYKIGLLKDQDKPAFMESSVAKLYISESYVESSLDAIRVFGGYGYMTEQQVERDLRDGIGGLLYSGTNDVQHNIIAKCLGLG